MAQKQSRTLAIAPSARGFGFAILDGEHKLVDWAVKTAKGDKNANALAKAIDLMEHYKPTLVVLEDATAGGVRRHPRIQALTHEIEAAAKFRGIRTKLFSREEVRAVYFGSGKGTKHALAELLVKWFPDELAGRVPRKRRAWTGEPYSIHMFDAIALVLMPFARRRKKTAAAHKECDVTAAVAIPFNRPGRSHITGSGS